MATEIKADLVKVEGEAWERPEMVRLDAADAQTSPGAGPDRNAGFAMVNS